MQKWIKRALVVAACVGLAFPACAAVEHFVWTNAPSSAYPFTSWDTAATNVQTAVWASTTGDVVTVTNGTYILTNTITIVPSNAITLRSVNGRDYTQLQMDLTWGSNRCISLTTTGTIDGFTIANGCVNGDNGGGIYMTAGTIQNCTVVSNSLTGTGRYGGGIYCSGGRIFNCLVISNSAYDCGGGVMLSSAVMGSNCVISGNSITRLTSVSGAGGVYMSGGASRITDCVVSNNTNTSGGYAAGLTMAGGYVSNCVFTDNRGPAGGLGVLGGTAEYCVVKNNILVNQQAACLVYGTLRNSVIHDNNKQSYDYRCTGLMMRSGGLVENCVISNNWGGNYGSGVRMQDGVTLRNCLVVSNGIVGGNFGGGIYFDSTGNSKIESCTVVSNYSLRGAGIYFAAANTTNVVINTIVFGNTAGESTSNIYETAGSVNWFTNCNVGATVSGANNINTNPAWVDPANYNFRLTAGSKCVNAGINQSWMTGAVDLDRRHRIDVFSGRVDMGCYEYLPSGTIFRIY